MKKEIKWGSLHNLSEPVPKKVIDDANEQAWRYVWDAANWVLEQSSSTSGMYGSWSFQLSHNTTVKDVTKNPPIGRGGDIIDAIKDWTTKMRAFCDEHGFER